MEYRNQIVNMDALSYLRTLPDGSVSCIVTSPPYYALRSYLPGKVKLRSDLPEEVRSRVIAELNSMGVYPTGDSTDAR